VSEAALAFMKTGRQESLGLPHYSTLARSAWSQDVVGSFFFTKGQKGQKEIQKRKTWLGRRGAPLTWRCEPTQTLWWTHVSHLH
jgi:hypothetical protein